MREDRELISIEMWKRQARLVRKHRLGFTLAELLIVVAIIAVLSAITIPIFYTQLEKSREAADISNLRSAYSAASTGDLADGTYIYDGEIRAYGGRVGSSVTGQGTDADGNTQSPDPHIIYDSKKDYRGCSIIVTVKDSVVSVGFLGKAGVEMAGTNNNVTTTGTSAIAQSAAQPIPTTQPPSPIQRPTKNWLVKRPPIFRASMLRWGTIGCGKAGTVILMETGIRQIEKAAAESQGWQMNFGGGTDRAESWRN